jgi:UMF1 family MFS transporter
MIYRDKKIISWALYDWANSSFATTVMAGFFPIMFKDFWSKGADPTLTTARLSLILSASGLLMAFLAPTLGALADHKGHKKQYIFLFMLLGVLATISLYFLPEGGWIGASFAYGLGMIGFYASCVFYDSLMPSITTAENANEVSSYGFALGYLGGGVLFALNVAMTLKPDLFGLTSASQAVQISFLSVGIWWFLFSIPLFVNVPELKPEVETKESIAELARHAFASVWNTIKKIRKERNLAIFLLAYWLYIDGVYTVITMAVDYGKSLNFETKHLISALLIVQFVGFPFAILFGRLTRYFRTKNLILFCLFVYMGTVIFATRMTNASEFYLLALAVAAVQGGVQALSRGMFANMIPHDRAAEYFGFFNLVAKFASIFGPMVVGITAWVTHDPRKGMLGLLILFLIGGGLLISVKASSADEVNH